MSDTVTLALRGEVTLTDFATAIKHFRGLVQALSKDVAKAPDLEWIVEDLSPGSAIATIRGRGAADRVDTVVRAYEQVGRALERRQRPPFTASIARQAKGLVGVLNGRIQAIRFETAEQDAIIRSQQLLAIAVPATAEQEPELQSGEGAYGAVEGRIQTLSSRGGLRFTLFDLLNDRAVSCYLRPGQEEIMLNAWDKLAVVEGWVRRDRFTGHPETIRQIRHVVILPEGGPEDYREARGVIPLRGASPEDIIRQLRDVQ
jgi:hypothetical protein